jgi:hypothetical protein
MVIPCKVKSTCADPSAPVTNFSSESADTEGFYGYNSYNQIDPPNPGQNWQPGAIFGPATCVSFNQQEADFCAGRKGPTDPTDPTSGPTNDPGGLPRHPAGPVKVYYSQTNSCASFCPDGSPFNYVLAAGAFVRNSQILADRAAQSYACTQARKFRVCLGTLTSSCCVNQPFAGVITASGAVTGVAIVSGALPTGLTMAFASGAIVISGTPTLAGNYAFSIQAQVGVGQAVTKAYSICVIGIFPATVPAAPQSVPYSQQMSVACGTVSAWAVSAGALPDGLTLDPVSGLLSGTPTKSGTFNFTVQVTANSLACSQTYSIKVANAANLFNALFWSNQAVSSFGGGTASGSFVGALFSVESKSNDGASGGTSGAYGTLAYTGPNVNCIATITVTENIANGFGRFGIFQDGFTLVDWTFPNGAFVGQVITIPFTISAGVASFIEVTNQVNFGVFSQNINDGPRASGFNVALGQA